MYESRKHPPLPRIRFIRRLVLHVVGALLLLLGSLLIGMVGYGYYENLAWRDAFLNSAMLLGGMGPVDAPKTDGGKVFAGLYALYAGLVFIVAAGLVFVPVLHRLLHKFHWDESESAPSLPLSSSAKPGGPAMPSATAAPAQASHYGYGKSAGYRKLPHG